MKNIFITGGNRGIGKGLVEIFSENYKVFFSARDEQKARSVMESIDNENIDFVTMDVADGESVLSGVELLKEKTD